jgi:hypothetical protein
MADNKSKVGGNPSEIKKISKGLDDSLFNYLAKSQGKWRNFIPGISIST